MRHRHLDHERFTLAAIDDVIARGRWWDWVELRRAVLVGGTAAAVHAKHRLSHATDHVMSDLKARFDRVLAELESVAGWNTARVQRPVQILGSLDGIETGARQLLREEPLETEVIDHQGVPLTVPTAGEMLRIKGILVLRRNATRDYVDLVALADHLGEDAVPKALQPLDRMYPQASGESALQQLQVQLAKPVPYDLEETDLSEYRDLSTCWHDWRAVEAACAHLSTVIFDGVCELQAGPYRAPES